MLYYIIFSEAFVVQLKKDNIFVFDTFLPLDPIYDFIYLFLTGEEVLSSEDYGISAFF